MHLVLINPPFTVFRRSEIVYSHCLGLLYIASYARSKGHRVTIIDALAEGIDIIEPFAKGVLRVGLPNGDIIARIPSNADLIGVSVPFSHLAHLFDTPEHQPILDR